MFATNSTSDLDVSHQLPAYYQALDNQPSFDDFLSSIVGERPANQLPSEESTNEA